jgi:hypothetical protein
VLDGFFALRSSDEKSSIVQCHIVAALVLQNFIVFRWVATDHHGELPRWERRYGTSIIVRNRRPRRAGREAQFFYASSTWERKSIKQRCTRARRATANGVMSGR